MRKGVTSGESVWGCLSYFGLNLHYFKTLCVQAVNAFAVWQGGKYQNFMKMTQMYFKNKFALNVIQILS